MKYFFLLLALAASSSEAQTAKIKIDIDRSIAEVNQNLFGAFVEPIHTTVYGSIYNPSSRFADKDGFRSDLIALAREVRVTNVRYPGGNMVSGYNWEDGIGPKNLRPARQELAWNQVDSNQMGMDEYFNFFNKIGATSDVCVNAGTGTLDQARHWVEYCNTPAGTWYAALRKKYGHEKPYAIKNWGIGNEVDGPWQIGYKSVEDYCKFALEAAKLMKWTDSSIRITASGSANYFNDEFPDADWIRWNRTVLYELRNHLDYLSIHRYWDNKKDYYTLMSLSKDIEEKISVTSALIRETEIKYRLKKPVYIAFDEFAVGRKPDLLNAICLAQYYNSFIRHADFVRQANFTQLADLFADSPKGFYKTPVSEVFKLFSLNSKGQSLDLQVSGPSFNAGLYRNVTVLDATAIYDRESGRLVVNVVNRSKDSTITTEIINQTGRLNAGFQARVLHSTDLNAMNTFDNKTVTVKSSALRLGGNTLQFAFQPHSFTQLVFSLKK